MAIFATIFIVLLLAVVAVIWSGVSYLRHIS